MNNANKVLACVDQSRFADHVADYAAWAARRLDAPPNTLSANLKVLSHAGLLTSRRQGRSIIYSARFDQMSQLLGYLMEDCCAGSPEICAPLAEVLARTACCVPEPHHA